MHTAVSVLQSCAVLALCGKAYLERPQKHSEGSKKQLNGAEPAASLSSVEQEVEEVLPRTVKDWQWIRNKAQAHLSTFLNHLSDAEKLHEKFRDAYDAWFQARTASLELLARAQRKLRPLEIRIDMTDCAGGVLGAAGGCLALMSLLLAPVSGGVSSILMAAGLGVEGSGAVFTCLQMSLKMLSRRLAAPSMRKVLYIDQQRTQELALVCNEICALYRSLTQDCSVTLAFVEDMQRIMPGSATINVKSWPIHRAMEVFCVSTESLCGMPIVAIESVSHCGAMVFTNSSKVLSKVLHTEALGHTAAMATGRSARSAARVATTVGDATASVALHSIASGTTKAVAINTTCRLKNQLAHASESACRAAGQGCVKAAAGGVSASGKLLASPTTVVGPGARTKAAVSSLSSHGHKKLFHSVAEVFGAGLTVCGIGLELLSGLRAARRIKHGVVSELETAIASGLENLRDNQKEFVDFQIMYSNIFEAITGSITSPINSLLREADARTSCCREAQEADYEDGGVAPPRRCICSTSTVASHFGDEDDDDRYHGMDDYYDEEYDEEDAHPARDRKLHNVPSYQVLHVSGYRRVHSSRNNGEWAESRPFVSVPEPETRERAANAPRACHRFPLACRDPSAACVCAQPAGSESRLEKVDEGDVDIGNQPQVTPQEAQLPRSRDSKRRRFRKWLSRTRAGLQQATDTEDQTLFSWLYL